MILICKKPPPIPVFMMLVRVPQLLVESRSPTDIDQELLLFEKSEDTRNLPSSLSESCPSNVLSVKLLKISRPICDSRDLLSRPYRKLQRLTWLDYSRIPTCVPSMPSVSQLCPRTSSWPVESVESVPKCEDFILQKNGYFYSHKFDKRNLYDLHSRAHFYIIFIIFIIY